MQSILSFVAVTALFAATNVAADGYEQTSEGCYSSSSGLTFNGTLAYNSRGSCGTQCSGAGYSVMGMTKKTDCYCGQSLPPSSSKVDDSKCNQGCAGFPEEMCGASGYWSLYLSGLTADVEESAASSSSSSSTTTTTSTPASTTSKTSGTSTAQPSVVTVKGQTVVVTASGSATASSSAESKSSGGGSSKAGIAAGVVVGVVAIAAILGGLYMFMRNRKRRDIEEEYKRSAAVSSFIAGGKPPTSSGGGSSFTDMRLDPAVMAQRRMSDGSIADNQDYSRRILKVTNA